VAATTAAPSGGTVPAAPSGPALQVTPQQVTAGDPVTITGSGYPPGAPVQAELFSDPVLLGSTTTDAAGTFRLTVGVPRDTPPGFHTLRVSVVGGTVAAETTISVSAPAAVQQAQVQAVQQPGGTAGLSRTGADTAGIAGAAVILVVTGVVLVGLGWRPRPSPLRRSPWR
jgi:hypothetical protein